MTSAEEPTPERMAQDTRIARFATALDAFHGRRFTAAAEAFATLVEVDAVAAHDADRARALAESPPGENWDGITNPTEK